MRILLTILLLSAYTAFAQTGTNFNYPRAIPEGTSVDSLVYATRWWVAAQGYLTAAPSWIQDSLDRHTDTLQAHNTRINSKSDTAHNHALNNLSEKSYNSLTDKPTLYDTTTSAWTKAAGSAYTRTGVSKVGIQRSNPTATLEVNSKSASAAQFRTYNSVLGEATPTDSLGLYVDKTGQVGIGTTAPTANLQINSAGDARINIMGGDAGKAAGLYYGEQYRDWSVERKKYNNYGNSRYDMEIKYAGTALGGNLLLNPTAYVGIGTTNPLEKLHVEGEARITDTIRVGNYTTYSYVIPGGNWVTSSTQSVKENITEIQEPTDLFGKVLSVNPKNYNFKAAAYRKAFRLADIPDSVMSDSVMKKLTLKERKALLKQAVKEDSLLAVKLSQRKFTGFIAEEINGLIGKDSKEVDQAEIIAILWKSNQKLIRKVNDLEERLAKIEEALK